MCIVQIKRAFVPRLVRPIILQSVSIQIRLLYVYSFSLYLSFKIQLELTLLLYTKINTLLNFMKQQSIISVYFSTYVKLINVIKRNGSTWYTIWTDSFSQKLTNVIRVQILLTHSVKIYQVYKYRVYYKYLLKVF